MKKNAYLWGNRREVGVIICLFLEWLDDNYSQMHCQQKKMQIILNYFFNRCKAHFL